MKSHTLLAVVLLLSAQSCCLGAWGPLHDAAVDSDVAKLTEALGETTDDDVDAKGGENDVTALHVAAHGGCVECVELLLSSGADIAATNKDGWTPMIAAASGGSDAVVAKLMDSDGSGGVDFAHAGEDGMTAMHHAVKNNHVGAAEEIAKHDNEALLHRDAKGRSALEYTEETHEAIDSVMIDKLAELKTLHAVPGEHEEL